MASNINPYNIDGTFPVAGQNNSSQGFRDNFTNIKNNFTYAESEISDLQAKALTISALNGQQLGNDMAGTQIIRPQLAAWTQTLFDNQTTEGTLILNFNQANFQKLTTLGPVNLQFANWPSSVGQGALGYGSMRVWIEVTNTDHTVTLPGSVSIGDMDLAGFNPATGTITFDIPGDYVFDFSSVDGGQNFLVFDLTRNRVQFRDPSFYFNTAVNPALLIGYNELSIETAVALEQGQDTVSIYGSINSVTVANLSQNSVNSLTTSFGTPGFTMTAARGNIEQSQIDPVVSTDYIGCVQAYAMTGAGNALGGFQQTAAIGYYVTGANVAGGGFGGNIAVFTRQDGDTNPVVHQAVGFENDQSTQLFGNLVLSNTGNSGYTSTYVPAHNTSAGTTGQVAWDQSYFYVCVATNSWKRITLPSTTW